MIRYIAVDFWAQEPAFGLTADINLEYLRIALADKVSGCSSSRSGRAIRYDGDLLARFVQPAGPKRWAGAYLTTTEGPFDIALNMSLESDKTIQPTEPAYYGEIFTTDHSADTEDIWCQTRHRRMRMSIHYHAVVDFVRKDDQIV